MKKSLWLKALALTLCVMMTVCLGLTVPVFAAEEYSVWDGSVETDWLKDSEKTHVIDSAAKLAGLAKLTNDAAIGGSTGAYEGHTFYLTVNVDLNGIEWAPIGFNYGVNFAGNLEGKLNGVEGQAATIKNLSITNNADHGNTGFIGTLRGGSVKNLTFVNANVTYADGSSQGVVVGYMSKAITAFENIKVIDSKVYSTATRDDEGIGAVVGYAKVDLPLNFKNIAVINTTVEGAIKETGGIIGFARVNAEGSNYTFENCYFSGSVKCTADNAGIIAGQLMHQNDGDVFTTKNVQVDGAKASSKGSKGALAGILTGATLVVENAVLIDSVEAVGNNAGSVDAIDCYATYNEDYCVTRSAAELTDLAAKDTLKGFDFGGAWTARAGKTAILTLAMGADDTEAGVVVEENVTSAPQTFDMGIIAAVSAIVSAAGYMLTKKR